MWRQPDVLSGGPIHPRVLALGQSRLLTAMCWDCVRVAGGQPWLSWRAGSASIAGIGTGLGDTLYCRPKFCAVFLCSAFCKLVHWYVLLCILSYRFVVSFLTFSTFVCTSILRQFFCLLPPAHPLRRWWNRSLQECLTVELPSLLKSACPRVTGLALCLRAVRANKSFRIVCKVLYCIVFSCNLLLGHPGPTG